MVHGGQEFRALRTIRCRAVRGVYYPARLLYVRSHRLGRTANCVRYCSTVGIFSIYVVLHLQSDGVGGAGVASRLFLFTTYIPYVVAEMDQQHLQRAHRIKESKIEDHGSELIPEVPP